MADRYRTPGGWTVEVVQLAAGKRLRIRHYGYYIADVRNADELAHWIPADELLHLERATLMPSPGRRGPQLALSTSCRGRYQIDIAAIGPATDSRVPPAPRPLRGSRCAMAIEQRGALWHRQLHAPWRARQ